MTTQKQDAFARAVEKVMTAGIVYPFGAEKLLRRHHAKIERLVRRLRKDATKVRGIVGWDDIHAKGMMDMADCVLAALRTMRE